ncbi:MAG: hypothetical protein M1604_00045 [Patescibacteria group bacterium]|nr:hypothetical protein [Patescibacteria group bacterium]
MKTKIVLYVAVAVVVAGASVYYAHPFSGAPSQSAGNQPSAIVPKQAAPGSSVSAAKPVVAPQVKPGTVTAYVVDQYGKSYDDITDPWDNGADVRIYDSLGEYAGRAVIKDGVLAMTAKSESDPSTTLPPGTYMMEVPDTEKGGLAGLTPVEEKFYLPPQGIDLGKIVFTRWGSVGVNVVNAVGTKLDGIKWGAVNCNISDEWFLKTSSRAGDFCGSMGILWANALQNGGLGSFPAGSYTFEFSADGYGTVQKSFTMDNADIDLGNVVLPKSQ